jgi:hypothetical protein
MLLPTWMRRALFATAAMNFFAGLLFLPFAAPLRALAGFPADAHAVYLMTCALFVILFAAGYYWAAAAGHVDALFLTIAALGKLGFFTLVTGFWLAGSLPARAAGLAAADLVFAVLFLSFLARQGAGATA